MLKNGGNASEASKMLFYATAISRQSAFGGFDEQPVRDTGFSLPKSASSPDSSTKSRHPSQGSPGDYLNTKFLIIYFKKKQNQS